jgi:hypothetical protein
MGAGGRPEDREAESDIHEDGRNTHTDDPKAVSSDDRGMS